MTIPDSAATAEQWRAGILEQLNIAFRAAGWSFEELVEKAGLLGPSGKPMDRTTIAKKMKGLIVMKDLEMQALATCLGVTIVWPSALPAPTKNEEQEQESPRVESVA